MHFRYFINLIIPHEPTFFYFLSSVRNSKGLLSIKFLCVTLPHMSIPSRNPAHSFQKSRAFLSGILRIPFRNPAYSFQESCVFLSGILRIPFRNPAYSFQESAGNSRLLLPFAGKCAILGSAPQRMAPTRKLPCGPWTWPAFCGLVCRKTRLFQGFRPYFVTTKEGWSCRL